MLWTTELEFLAASSTRFSTSSTASATRYVMKTRGAALDCPWCSISSTRMEGRSPWIVVRAREANSPLLCRCNLSRQQLADPLWLSAGGHMRQEHDKDSDRGR